MPYGKGTYGSKVGRPRKRVKGGQRLMQLSKAGLKRRQARVGGKKYVTPLPKKKVAKKVAKKVVAKKVVAKPKPKVAPKSVTKAAPKKAAPKSTVGGRNKTAMRTPKGTTIPKKAVRKSDANKYKGPERFRATPKKKVATKPTGKKRTYLDDMPANMKGRESMMDAVKSKGPGAALDAALIAQFIASRGRSPKGAVGRTLTRLKKSPIGKKFSGLFKGKPKVKKPTKAEMEKTKKTEEGYKKFDADRKARSRKRKPKS